MNRLQEFFEDTSNRLSMSRLLMFMTWFPSVYIAVKVPTVESLAALGGLFVVNSAVNKISEAYVDASPTPPAQVTINQPEKVNT